MRIDSAGFALINESTERDPRYVVHVDFGGTPNTSMYITSHVDAKVPPGTAIGDTYKNMLRNISGTSQKIDPIKALASVGAISFDVIDFDEVISARIKTEYGSDTGDTTAADKGLRGKTVKFYIGEAGLDWADYVLIQTQLVKSVSLNDEVYKFSCADIQRNIRGTIFKPYRTTLSEPIDDIQTAILVEDCTDNQTLQHGPAYTSFPNEAIGYIEIKKEVIAWRNKLVTDISAQSTTVSFSGNVITSSGIDFTQFSNGQQLKISNSASNNGTYYINAVPTANTITVVENLVTESAGALVTVSADTQFYNCSRGVLNTRAVEHTMPTPLPSASRRTKVQEGVYLELPLPKLVYAILTGSLYGTADVLPSNWHLNISTDFIATSEFINVGLDHWDPTDDSIGFPVRFNSPKTTSGKKFIEEELLLLGGFFMPVLTDGQLGFRRMSRVLNNASYVAVLNETNIISISPLLHNMERVYNQFDIQWNWNKEEKKFTRNYRIIDGNSITRHGLTKPLVMSFQGLHGTSSTESMLVEQIDTARDRYAGPPQEITVNCLFNTNALEVGDIVKLKLSGLQDFVAGGSINRSFEIQSVSTNWRDGTVKLKLFGSSQAADTIGDAITASRTLTTAYYTGTGTDLSTYGTVVGSVLTIDADATLTGTTNLNDAASIFYFDGDVIVDTGVTLTVKNNVQLRIKGDLSVDGTIDGNGFGMVAPAKSSTYGYNSYAPEGVAGGIGTTQAPGKFIDYNGLVNYDRIFTAGYEKVVRGKYNTMPPFGLINTGNTLSGLPTDLRGTSGGNGGAVFMNLYGTIVAKFTRIADAWYPGYSFDYYGEKGGDGGAGLAIVAYNVFTSGKISLDGNDGVIANNYAGGTTLNYIHASSGAGGSSGGLLIIIDGNGNAITDGVDMKHGVTSAPYLLGNVNRRPFSASYGKTKVNLKAAVGTAVAHYGSFKGLGPGTKAEQINVSDSFMGVQHTTAPATAVIDEPQETSKASAITVVEVGPTASTLNQTAIEVSVSAPTGSGPFIDNYKASHIYARKTTNDSWFDIGTVGPIGELSYSVPSDGSTWEVKGHAISNLDVESGDYISTTITVTAALETVIGTGNKIVTNTAPQTNGGVEVSTGGLIGYDGAGIQRVKIDAATGKITASDVVLSGTITANAGSVGGWTINASDIQSPDGKIILDSTNNHIQVQNAGGTNYTRMNADGVTGVDSVLGTVFRLPTDGTPPSFSSGVINSTVFNITSSGILETSSTVGDGTANGQGVRINDTGIKGYEANNTTPVFTLDATVGQLSVGDTNDYLTYSSAAGLQVGTGATTVKGIRINAASSNEIQCFGDLKTTIASVGLNASAGVRTIGTDSVCLFGGNSASTSNLTGVFGQTGTGAGVRGETTGSGNGIIAETSATGSGVSLVVFQHNTASSTNAANITQTGTGVALNVNQNHTTSNSYAIDARNKGNAGAIRGIAELANRAGVFGQTISSTGKGLSSLASSTATAVAYGLYSQAGGPTSVGVYGQAYATSGVGYGIYGVCGSASGFDFYAAGAGTNYGPFTGAHDGILPNGTIFEIGDIIIDDYKLFASNISNTIFANALSTTANEKGIIGIIASEMEDLEDFDPAEDMNKRPAALVDMPDAEYQSLMTTHKRISFNAVGEGQINVCGEGGDLVPGDLIVTSSIPGKGKKQSNDIVRGYTVAKVREAVTFANATEVKMVACIYLCG